MLLSTVNANDGRKNYFDSIDPASYQCYAKPTIVSHEDSAKLESLEDVIATAQLKQAMVEHTGFVTAVELLAMRSLDIYC
jgi:hypothetical protein